MKQPGLHYVIISSLATLVIIQLLVGKIEKWAFVYIPAIQLANWFLYFKHIWKRLKRKS